MKNLNLSWHWDKYKEKILKLLMTKNISVEDFNNCGYTKFVDNEIVIGIGKYNGQYDYVVGYINQ